MNDFDKALALRSAELFSELSADALLPMAALCREVELDPGQLLFQVGDPGDSLYIITEGAVTVERDDQHIATLGVGQCVGEMAALDWEPRSATVRCEAPTRLIRLDRNDLMDLLSDDPLLVRNLARVLVSRIRSSN